MTTYLIASANAAYANRITAWLDYATAHAPEDWRIVLACVEMGNWQHALANEYPSVTFISVTRVALPFIPPLDHLQAGGFLDAIPHLADDDLILFTDGDAYLQRAPTPDEAEWFADWPADAIGLGYNDGPQDTLGTEAARLRPTGDPADLGFDLGLPVFNLGVIVARAAAYRRWLACYVPIEADVRRMFNHHAAQQWGLCAALPATGLRTIVVPATIHAHGHYPLPFGQTLGRAQGRITVDGTVALFRHHL